MPSTDELPDDEEEDDEDSDDLDEPAADVTLVRTLHLPVEHKTGSPYDSPINVLLKPSEKISFFASAG